MSAREVVKSGANASGRLRYANHAALRRRRNAARIARRVQPARHITAQTHVHGMSQKRVEMQRGTRASSALFIKANGEAGGYARLAPAVRSSARTGTRHWQDRAVGQQAYRAVVRHVRFTTSRRERRRTNNRVACETRARSNVQRVVRVMLNKGASMQVLRVGNGRDGTTRRRTERTSAEQKGAVIRSPR